MFEKRKDNFAEQLTIAFGKKKAKEILKQIAEIKEKNPGQAYSFIFKEDGSFIAVEKGFEEEE